MRQINNFLWKKRTHVDIISSRVRTTQMMLHRSNATEKNRKIFLKRWKYDNWRQINGKSSSDFVLILIEFSRVLSNGLDTWPLANRNRVKFHLFAFLVHYDAHVYWRIREEPFHFLTCRTYSISILFAIWISCRRRNEIFDRMSQLKSNLNLLRWKPPNRSIHIDNIGQHRMWAQGKTNADRKYSESKNGTK